MIKKSMIVKTLTFFVNISVGICNILKYSCYSLISTNQLSLELSP